MTSSEILTKYQLIKEAPSDILLQPSSINPLTWPRYQVRLNSASFEDAFFGDSGKGSGVAKFNELLICTHGELVSLRYNGGANAGHETVFNGITVVTHQLPTGIIREGATALISRGMVLHPEDLVTEIDIVSKQLHSDLPGKLIIDPKTPLALDTHRAYEEVINRATGVSGSTGRGISPAYSSIYEKHPILVEDLMAENWEQRLRKHYLLYQQKVAGFGYDIKNNQVYNMEIHEQEKTGKEARGKDPREAKGLRPVGTGNEFIDRLRDSREKIKKYVGDNFHTFLLEAWENEKIPFTIEGAQGAGLDPFHGIYPDITASRPMTSNIADSTYGVIIPTEIAARFGVMKTTYMSSVGSRRLPEEEDETFFTWAQSIQEEFKEFGRSTGRLREIHEVSIPIGQYLRRVAGYEYLLATHLDTAKTGQPVRVISHYTDRETGEERPYLPYQDYLDRLKPNFIEFAGWNGSEVVNVRSPQDLPYEARVYLAFLSRVLAPVVMATTGPDLNQYISWIK